MKPSLDKSMYSALRAGICTEGIKSRIPTGTDNLESLGRKTSSLWGQQPRVSGANNFESLGLTASKVSGADNLESLWPTT